MSQINVIRLTFKIPEASFLIIGKTIKQNKESFIRKRKMQKYVPKTHFDICFKQEEKITKRNKV